MAGQKSFDVGDLGEMMYAVVGGAVGIEVDDREIDYLEPDSIFGKMALSDDSPRSAAAVVAVDSQIVPVDRRQFEFLVHNHPSFALQVMAVSAEWPRR
ncbi:MAG: cyclic nucleotide-binding domain-containing protein [Candidatus Promineifilaceae bacterium]|nr:cyclic nucleotide-binding domain-containing protein [Candidatus Promineifilaceae bacterium]